MDVTTINITTVGLSNTESEVNYESDPRKEFAKKSQGSKNPTPSVNYG